jgi:predicted dehydrogenase/sugar phosphate isomerase/epimerase
MSRISFMTANYVARQLGYKMTEGWGQGDQATNDYFQPLGTFRQRFDELLAEISGLGFESIDLWSAHLHYSWATPEHIAIATELLAKHKLTVASYAGMFGGDAAEFESACRLAVALKIPILGGSTPLLAKDRTATVALLKKYKLVLAIENHPEKSADEMLAQIGDGGQGTIATTVDTGWYADHKCDVVAVIQKLGRHIKHVHLKDVRPSGKHQTCRFGFGCVPVAACVQALEKMGYKGGYSVEHEPSDFDPSHDCELGRAMLQTWLPAEKKPFAHKPLRVGIVGCGNIAGPYEASLITHPEVEFIGAADMDPNRAKSLTAKFGGKAYRSVKALLADPTIELVVNLTIHHAHKKITTLCLKAGKHVHSEKPLALTHKEAQGLVALAKEKGLRLGCCPATFLGEAAQTAWKMIRDGKLGPVRLAYAEANWGRIESWHPAPGPFYQVGALFDVGVYPLTMLTAIFGPAKRVTGYGKVLHPDRVTKEGIPFHIDTPDFAVAAVELASGMVVRLTTNFYVTFTSKQTGIEFHGDLGSIHMSCWQDYKAAVEFQEFNGKYQPVELVRKAYSGNEWGRAVVDMADAIRDNRPHRATGEQAAHVVEILCGIVKSAKNGKSVEITSTFTQPAPMEWGM